MVSHFYLPGGSDLAWCIFSNNFQFAGLTFPLCNSMEIAGNPTGSAMLKIIPFTSAVRNSKRSSRYLPTWKLRSKTNTENRIKIALQTIGITTLLTVNCKCITAKIRSLLNIWKTLIDARVSAGLRQVL